MLALDGSSTPTRNEAADAFAGLTAQRRARLGEFDAFWPAYRAALLPSRDISPVALALDRDPAGYFARLRCPLLAVYAGRDMHVPATANRDALIAQLQSSDHPDYTIRVFPEANHQLQDVSGGSRDALGRLGPVFTEKFEPFISRWVSLRLASW